MSDIFAERLASMLLMFQVLFLGAEYLAGECRLPSREKVVLIDLCLVPNIACGAMAVAIALGA